MRCTCEFDYLLTSTPAHLHHTNTHTHTHTRFHLPVWFLDSISRHPLFLRLLVILCSDRFPTLLLFSIRTSAPEETEKKPVEQPYGLVCNTHTHQKIRGRTPPFNSREKTKCRTEPTRVGWFSPRLVLTSSLVFILHLLYDLEHIFSSCISDCFQFPPEREKRKRRSLVISLARITEGASCENLRSVKGDVERKKKNPTTQRPRNSSILE